MNNFNIWYLHPYAGGPGFGNSSRAFLMSSEWISRNHDVTVFCSSWHHLMGENKNYNGINVLEGVRYNFIPTRHYKNNGIDRLLNMFDYCSMLLFQNTKYVLKFGKPNIIIVSSPHPYVIFVAKHISEKFGSKLIFEVRDLWPLSLIELANVSSWHPLVLLTSFVEEYAYKNSDACVSLLPNAKTYMVEHGLPSDHFYYIPNGAQLTDEHMNNVVDDIAIRHIQELRKTGKFVLIYTGAMGPPNNLVPLVQAAKLLQDMKADHVNFILMGHGVEADLLKSLALKNSLSNIFFYPQSTRQVANALMRNASAGYSSLKRAPIFYHGVSVNKIFEYMHNKLPIIFAADVPKNPVELSECGLLTSPDDPQLIAESIYSLSKKSEFELQEIGKLGYKYVLENHDYKILAQKYLDLFEAILP